MTLFSLTKEHVCLTQRAKMNPHFVTPWLQSFFLETNDLLQTYRYAVDCRAKGEQLVSPFPSKTPERSVQETLHLVLFRNHIPLELRYYIADQYLYQTSDPVRRARIITYCCFMNCVNHPDYERVYEYAQYLFGSGFLEDVDDVPFFNDKDGSSFRNCLVADLLIPFKVQRFRIVSNNATVKEYMKMMVKLTLHERRHLIRHYSPAALAKQVTKEGTSVLQWLIAQHEHRTDVYDLVEHCLATLPPNVE
jgi:hypothetical protein